MSGALLTGIICGAALVAIVLALVVIGYLVKDYFR